MKKLILAMIAVCAFAVDEYSIKVDLNKIIDSSDFKELLGDDMEFIFGSGYSGEIITSKTIETRASDTKKNNRRFQKSISGNEYKFDKWERICGYALVQTLKKFKKEAITNKGSKIVNIISLNETLDRLDSKDSFFCVIRKRAAVELNADIIK